MAEESLKNQGPVSDGDQAGTIEVLTVGRIAELIGRTRDQVQYIIKTRKIKPICRVGIARVFSPTQMRQIDMAITQHQSKRQPLNQSALAG